MARAEQAIAFPTVTWFIVEPLAVRPGGSGTAVFQTFKDFGIKTRKIGLTAELLASYVDIKIGLDGSRCHRRR